MRPVDSFLRSVRDAFQPSEATSGWVWVVMVVGVVSALGAIVMMRRRQRQAERQAFATLLAERKISPGEARLIDRVAALAGVPPRLVATQVDVFERATALELRGHPPPTTGVGEGIFAEVGAVRGKLGFQQRAGNFALLTTRELSAGQAVRVAGVEGNVIEVNEAFFAVAVAAVTVAAKANLAVGATGTLVRVTFAHGHEARYETRCALLARHQADAFSHKLVFAHDEQPTRIQLRRSVRVTVRGPVHLHGLPVEQPAAVARDPAAPEPVPADTAATGLGGDHAKEGNGALLDISVGGAALEATVHVPVGSLVRLSFALDGSTYHDLLAHVLECDPRPRGTHHMRLEFRNLPQVDEHHLAASVARYSAKPFTPEAA
jgi:preprotein translocase subunit YajC